MKNKKQDKRGRLERRLSPFSSEEDRLDALENLRKWIEKLEGWRGEIHLGIEVSKRDLN
jgi:hypothetical protein